MNCIIVDDESWARELLEDNFRHFTHLNLVGLAKSATEALVLLAQGNIDLMFLDIQMPGLTGLDLLNNLRKAPMVIMVTAFEEHALEGFELEVVDYLVKPVPFQRFAKAVQKATKLHKLHMLEAKPVENGNGYVFVNANFSLVKVMLEDILFIESMRDYVRIHLSTGEEIITRLTLKTVEEKLDPSGFMRIHKSYIVALARIDKIQKTELFINGKEIPIGEGYRPLFQSYLDRKNL